MTSSPPSGPVARPSLLKRLVSAQESGLIFVILLLGLALTFFGGTKPGVPIKFTMPQDAVVSSDKSGAMVITSATGSDFAAALRSTLGVANDGANLKVVVGTATTGVFSARSPRVLDGPPQELWSRGRRASSSTPRT